MKNKSASLSLLIGAFVVMVLAAASVSIVRAVVCGAGASTTWNTTDSSWFTSGNWTNGVPNSGKCAFINNSHTATIDSGSGDASAYNLVLGNSQGDSGSVVVSGADLDVAPSDPDCGGPIYVGDHGTGNLTINARTVNARYVYIAASTNPTKPNSNGTVTVENGASLLVNPGDCSGAGICIGCGPDGNGGTGVLTIKDATVVEVDNLGTVSLPGVQVGPSGTLTGNSTLKLTGSTGLAKTVSVVGTVAPTGTLTMQGNLDLTANGTSSLSDTFFHVTPTAQDSVQVSSATGGGTAKLGGRVTVAISGTFSLPVSYTLLHADTSLIGSFDFESFISTGSFCKDISYDLLGNNVVLNLYTCP